jgi:hypothetical protein
MRVETEHFIGELHQKDQKSLAGHRAQIEEIESRISPDRPIYGVISSGMFFPDGRADSGVLALSSYGMHWCSRRANYDWPWDKVNGLTTSAVGTIGKTVILTFDAAGKPMRFHVGDKSESGERFVRALQEAQVSRPLL